MAMVCRTVTDAKNQTITYDYDAHDRLVLVDYPTGTDTIYYYDGDDDGDGTLDRSASNGTDDDGDGDTDEPDEDIKGVLGFVTDASGSTKRWYDIRYNVNQEEKTIGSQTATTEFQYDAFKLTGIKYPGDTGWTAYTFNAANEATGLSAPGQAIVNAVTYNPFGKITQMDFGNGASNAYSYFPASGNFRLQNITVTDAGSPSQEIMNRSYSYDNVGNILTIDDTNNAYDQSFSYDDLYRLTAQTTASFIGGAETFTYSQTGNIESKNGNAYTYNAGTHQVTNDGVNTYSYDANGNMNAKNSVIYDYDYHNRLIAMSTGEHYEYDFSDRRVKKTENGKATYYFNEYYEVEVQTPPAAILTSPSWCVDSLTPVFTWEEAPGATRYLLGVLRTSDRTVVFTQGYTAAEAAYSGGTCSVTSPQALPNEEDYTWLIRTWNEAEPGPWSAPLNVTVNAGYCPPPPTAVPEAAALIAPEWCVQETAPTLTWAETVNASHYYVVVKRVSDQQVVHIQWYPWVEVHCDGSTCTLPMPGLTDKTDDFWNVRTANQTYGAGPWGTGRVFTVNEGYCPAQPTAVPGAITLIAPAGCTTDTTPTLTWTETANASHYYVWVQRVSDQQMVHGQAYPWYETDCDGSTCSSTIPALSEDSYTWKVLAASTYGNGPWSASMSFEVATNCPIGMLNSPELAAVTFQASESGSDDAVTLRDAGRTIGNTDNIVTVDGQTLRINVAASPELNYGFGDFSVVVRTSFPSSEGLGVGSSPLEEDQTSAKSPLEGGQGGVPLEEPVLSEVEGGQGGVLPFEGPVWNPITSNLGEISHIAAGVRQSDNLSLYLDGELQAQKTIGSKRVKRLNVNIGLEDATEAVIEDVQLFDYALFPEDIAELSTKKSPLEGGQGGVSHTFVKSPLEGGQGGVLPGSAGVSPASDDGPVLLGDGDGPVVTTTITYYYLNGQRVAQAKDGVFTWIHAGHLSSATRITDVNGLEVCRLAYTSFGEEAENQGSGDEPKYTYTGKEHDATGLYYSGARYYDPALSRFITADTVYDAGPQGLNRYSYTLNNPIIYRDPTGHQVEHWYQTVWVKPIETVQSTVNAGLVWVEEASGHHPLVLANTVPVKTISDTNFGALKSGLGVVTLGEESGEWLADPSNPNKIPVFGPKGKKLGESWGAAIVDPNVETISRAVAATADAVGTALGGVLLARMLGVPGIQGNPIKPLKVSEGKRVLGSAENIEIEVEGNVVELGPEGTLEGNTNPTQIIDVPQESKVRINVQGDYIESLGREYNSNSGTPPVIIRNNGASEIEIYVEGDYFERIEGSFFAE